MSLDVKMFAALVNQKARQSNSFHVQAAQSKNGPIPKRRRLLYIAKLACVWM